MRRHMSVSLGKIGLFGRVLQYSSRTRVSGQSDNDSLLGLN